MVRKMIVTLVSAALVLIWATPAHASFAFHDGFETVPTSWGFERVGNGDGSIETDPPFAHSGSSFADVASGGAGSWSSVGRSVHIGTGHVLCSLSASIYPMTFGSGAPDKVNIEVINPTTWTYLGVTTWSTNSGSSWQGASVAFSDAVPDVYIRFSVLGEAGWWISVEVDDASVFCAL